MVHQHQYAPDPLEALLHLFHPEYLVGLEGHLNLINLINPVHPEVLLDQSLLEDLLGRSRPVLLEYLAHLEGLVDPLDLLDLLLLVYPARLEVLQDQYGPDHLEHPVLLADPLGRSRLVHPVVPLYQFHPEYPVDLFLLEGLESPHYFHHHLRNQRSSLRLLSSH